MSCSELISSFPFITIEHLACFLDMLLVSLRFKLTLSLVQLSGLIPWCPSSEVIDFSMCVHYLHPLWSNYHLTLITDPLITFGDHLGKAWTHIVTLVVP